MLNFDKDKAEAFQKENGMKIEEAFKHIETWIEEKNIVSAEAGIEEIKKFAEDLPEVQDLEKKLRFLKTENIEDSNQESVENINKKSDLDNLSKSDKFIAAVGYFSYASVLPLVLKRNNEFCLFHGKQALVLAIMQTMILPISFIFPGKIYFLSLLFLAVSIFGFLKAFKGKLWNLPILGELANKLPLD